MSDPHDEDFLKEITDMLDKPEASAPRTPPVTHRRPRRRRRFPWLACGTMLLTGALIFACFRYVQDRGRESAASTTPTTTVAGEGDTLTIAAAGDVNVTQALLDSARGADGSYDFSRMILGAAPLLSGADLTVADLEVNFCGAPYDPAAYNAPESLLTALSGAGVDLVQTANTVSVYNGVAGLSSTLPPPEGCGLRPENEGV